MVAVTARARTSMPAVLTTVRWLLLLHSLLQLQPTAAGSPGDSAQQQCDFAVFDGATADDASLFARHVRQRQPTLLAGATALWPAVTEWQPFERFARRFAELQLPVRKPITTARGQSFRRASRHVTLGQWARRLQAGGAPPFVFDTNGSSGILPALGADIRPVPAGLATVLKTSLFSLAGACASQACGCLGSG